MRKTDKRSLRAARQTGIITIEFSRFSGLREALVRMKSKIFSIVGLVMGCISVSISVTGLVFSAIGLAKTKGIRAPRKF